MIKTTSLLNVLTGTFPSTTGQATTARMNQVKKVFLKSWLPLAGLVLAASVTLVAVGQGSPPTIKNLNLSADPLFAAGAGDKPTMALALSVEFPTVGAQYRDAVYNDATEYLGYYDAESCYRYNRAPTEVVNSAAKYSDYKRFDKIGAATLRKCTGGMDGFSGNFLNFASSSSIDMLRLALSGGDRVVDLGSSTYSLTILQRAVLPNGDPTCMWNSGGNFPAKSLPKDGGNYLGAVPTVMRTSATNSITNGADIVVANTLNQIYFGVSSSSTAVVTPNSGCNNTGNYNLGGAAPVAMGAVTNLTQSLPSDASAACAGENGTCSFTGVREVWYGAGSKWAVAPASSSVSCSNSVFGDPIPGTAKACYTRTYSGAWTPGSSGSLNSDGFFFARVQVCNVDASKVLLDTRDYNFCTRQPNGFYKPTGSIQKYSDQLRLAAFGYVMDQTASYNTPTPGRYGGVLRTPMKYVGAKTFDINGIDNTAVNGNPNAEWDANTGVFKDNPDTDLSQTVPISGIINYLNKFGRTGPVAGRYKKFDPVSELYGEALRYLQGLGPTSVAVSGLTTPTDAIFDGFPVSTTWTDPFGGGRPSAADYSCLKTNIVVIGDVNTHDSDRLMTRTADLSNNLPNFSYSGGGWNQIVKDFERNAATNYLDGQGVTRITGNPNTANTNTPSVSGGAAASIMGQAYWAHTQDIRGTNWTASPALQRPGLRVKSFFFDVNEGGSQTNATNRQFRNQFFTASKYGGFESDPSNVGAASYNTFGNPFRKQDNTVDNNVWQDDANPGEAGTYYLSSSARGTLNAFESIFSRSATAGRSIAKSAVSSKNLTTAGSAVYQGAFDTADWSGDVLSTSIILAGTSTVSLGTSPTWSAAALLSNRTASSRNIVIGREGSTTNPPASSFLWASLDSTMQTNLNKLTPATAEDTLGQDRLNYLRGDKVKEGAPFRTRSKLLGDIINSGIVYSGTPTNYVTPYTSAYRTFVTDTSARTPAVFVGANDGMLHAFNANTGAELFGYIPSWLGSKLAALTVNSYNANHQAYVDATPVVSEAQVGSAGTASDWKTVLISGTGAGGPGVFALDVTDPAAFSASKVMWEFTKADDADMGFVVGRPRIFKMRTSAPAVSPATYRWFALVASGVNNYVPYPDAAGAFSSTGNPALFLLALDKPAGVAWTTTGGTPNYYKLTLPVDTALNATNATGLINVEATLGLNREVSQVYMGDLHGKVWRLDFSQRGTANWTFNELSFYKTGPAAPYPLYIAKTAAGAVQPITMPPTIVSAGTIGGVRQTYVAFGTGKYLETSDKSSVAQNSVYVVYEDGTTTSLAGGAVIPGRGRLQAGSINTTTFAVTVPSFKWGRPLTDGDVTKRAGYYFDYVVSGEKSISAIGVTGDFLVFGTVIPLAAGTQGACSASGGGGNVYQINVDKGVGTTRRIINGVFGEQLTFDVPSATTYSISSSTGKGKKILRPVTIDVTSQGISISSSGDPNLSPITGSLSWRQINNYQDLKRAP